MAKDKATYLEKYLSHRIRDTDWPKGGMLPPVRRLAEDLKAAPVTVLKAIQGLHRRGLILKPDGGKRWFTLAGWETHQQVLRETRQAMPRHLEIAEILKKEILLGNHPSDNPLPHQKEIVQRFGCSARTARTAYGELERRGLVKRWGTRHLAAKAKPAARMRSRIYLAGDPSILTAFHAHAFPLILSVEREVYALDGRELGFYLTESPAAESAPRDHEVAAYLYLAQRGLHQWMGFLARKRKVPAVVMDYTELTFTQNLAGHPHILQLLPDNRRAGREMGLYLRGLGHSRAALFTPWPIFEGWSALRLAGLQEIHPEAPHYFPAEGKRSAQLPPRIQAAASRFIKEIGRNWEYHPRQLKGMEHDLFDSARQGGMGRNLEPIFERALRDSSLTAWVGINDEVAVVACAWLRKKGVRVPQDIEVAGFDNSPLSYALGFTSYDFDFPKMGLLAVQGVVRPRSLFGLGRHGNVVRVPGRVIPRRIHGA